MRQNVVRDDTRGLRRVDARLHRKASQRRVHLCNRVETHVPLIFAGGYPQKGGARLPVVRMALFASGYQNAGIEENPHGLSLQHGFEPLLANLLNYAIPFCARLRDAPVHP